MHIQSLVTPFLLALISTPVLGAPPDFERLQESPTFTRRHARSLQVQVARSSYKHQNIKRLFGKGEALEVLGSLWRKIKPSKSAGLIDKNPPHVVFGEIHPSEPPMLSDPLVLVHDTHSPPHSSSHSGSQSVGPENPPLSLKKETDPVTVDLPKNRYTSQGPVDESAPFWTKTKKIVAGVGVGVLAAGGVGYVVWQHAKPATPDNNCPYEMGDPEATPLDPTAFETIQSSAANGTTPFSQWFLVCATGMRIDDRNKVVKILEASPVIKPEAGRGLTDGDSHYIENILCSAPPDPDPEQTWDMVYNVAASYPEYLGSPAVTAEELNTLATHECGPAPTSESTEADGTVDDNLVAGDGLVADDGVSADPGAQTQSVNDSEA
ncbi:hypothetical protein FRB95_014268 [Tulasnella sp. JGI-2019a]|nr:hypothetical protein FRB95_014268 [Tulasnella sp. JGI-2019a]